MNDILFGNNNKKIIDKLALSRLKSNKQRNLFVISAIILTTVLFSAFFSAYGGLLNQARQMDERMFGTRHAAIKFLSQDQYEKLKSSKRIKEVFYTRLVGMASNKELSKLNTEVRYAQEGAAKSFLCYPTTGTMPQLEEELATSTLVLDALGIPYKLGELVPLLIEIDGTIYEKEFRLCGFWDGYKIASAQEIWVSLSYANQVAPAAKQSLKKSGRYAGLFCVDVNFPYKWNLEKQLYELISQDIGAEINSLPASVNPLYQMFSFKNIDIFLIFAIIVLLMIVMLIGYFIIYNLFFISVTQDIQFFGLLRAIGASGEQIKKIVQRQAIWLALFGIPFGLIGGYLIGCLLLPFVITQTSIIDSGKYQVPFLFLVGAAIFSFVTVYISSRKPCNYAAKISAIEAVSYSGIKEKIGKKERKQKKISVCSMAVENLKRNRKKAIFVILSLGLSITLLDLTYTAVTGFDFDTYMEQNLIADFYISDYSIQQAGIYQKNFSGVSKEVLDKINQLPGLENSASVYAQAIIQKLPDKMGERVAQEYPEQYREILSTEHKCASLVYGIEDTLLDQVELVEGTWDMELWESGKGVILTDFYYEGNFGPKGASPLYQIGDELCLKEKDGKERSFQVMGIGEIDHRLNARVYLDLGIMILLPDSCFLELYGETQPLCTIFNIEDSYIEDTEKWILEYCENIEKNLSYRSSQIYKQEFQQAQVTYSIIGGVLSTILAFIGILNFSNMTATSIIIRQKELTMLSAVGMSERQIKQMLILESFSYIGLAVLWTITIGKAINYFICKNIIAQMWAFRYTITLLPIFIMLVALLGIAWVIPLGFYRTINQKSIVERLRFE